MCDIHLQFVNFIMTMFHDLSGASPDQFRKPTLALTLGDTFNVGIKADTLTRDQGGLVRCLNADSAKILHEFSFVLGRNKGNACCISKFVQNN